MFLGAGQWHNHRVDREVALDVLKAGLRSRYSSGESTCLDDASNSSGTRGGGQQADWKW